MQRILEGLSGVECQMEDIIVHGHMAEPADIHQLRRLLGMVTETVGNLAELTHPLRELLSKKHACVWIRPQQRAFETVKEKPSSAPALAILRPLCPLMHHRTAWLRC